MAWRWRTLIAIALAVFVLDQWTKLLVVEALTPGIARAHAASTGVVDRATGAATESQEARAEQLGGIGLLTKIKYFYGDPATRSPCDGWGTRCPPLRFFDGFWDWRYAENKGAAWSMFARMDGRLRLPFLLGVSIVALGFIFAFVRKLADSQRLLVVALSLITGGALGNLVDRARLGYVIDFIDWYSGATHFPTFNVADSGITTGVALIALGMILDLRASRAGHGGGRDESERLASSTR